MPHNIFATLRNWFNEVLRSESKVLKSLGVDQPVLVVPLRSPGYTEATPESARKIREACENVSKFYSQVTYGKTTFRHTYTDWIELSEPMEFYRADKADSPSLWNRRFEVLDCHLGGRLDWSGSELLIPIGKAGVSRRVLIQNGRPQLRQIARNFASGYCVVARPDPVDGSILLGYTDGIQRIVPGSVTGVSPKRLGTRVHDLAFHDSNTILVAQGSAGLGIFSRQTLEPHSVTPRIETESPTLAVIAGTGGISYAICAKRIYAIRRTINGAFVIATTTVVDSARCALIAGSYLFVGLMHGLQVFNIGRSPDRLELVTTIVSAQGVARIGAVTGLTVVGNRIFFSSLLHGIFSSPIPASGSAFGFVRSAAPVQLSSLSSPINEYGRGVPDHSLIAGIVAKGMTLASYELGLGLRLFSVSANGALSEVQRLTDLPIATRSKDSPYAQAATFATIALKNYLSLEQKDEFLSLSPHLFAEITEKAQKWLSHSRANKKYVHSYANVLCMTPTTETVAQAFTFNERRTCRDDVLDINGSFPKKSFCIADRDWQTLAHEVGHVLLLEGLVPGETEKSWGFRDAYADPEFAPVSFDLMGSSASNSLEANNPVGRANIFCGANLYRLGAYQVRNIALYTTLQLFPWMNRAEGKRYLVVEHGIVENVDSRRCHMVMIGRQSADGVLFPYFVELRASPRLAPGMKNQDILFDSRYVTSDPSSAPASGVLVSALQPNSGQRPRLIAANGGFAPWTPLKPGNSIDIDSIGVRITVVREVTASPLCYEILIEELS